MPIIALHYGPGLAVAPHAAFPQVKARGRPLSAQAQILAESVQPAAVELEMFAGGFECVYCLVS